MAHLPSCGAREDAAAGRAAWRIFRAAARVRTLLRGALHGAGGADALLVEGELITWVGRGEPPQRPDEEVVAGLGEGIAPRFIDPRSTATPALTRPPGPRPSRPVPEPLPPPA